MLDAPGDRCLQSDARPLLRRDNKRERGLKERRLGGSLDLANADTSRNFAAAVVKEAQVADLQHFMQLADCVGKFVLKEECVM
jgi:hypothetical protein